MVRKQTVAADLVTGAVAGAVATWVMGKATTYLYQNESKAARDSEDSAREGKTAYGVAAEKAAHTLGADLSEEQRQKYSSAIHWALGIGAGALYAVLRRRLQSAALGRGLLFGAAFWLLIDEVATPVIGLTPGPRVFPWQTHARGLAGHLVFGTAAEGTLEALEAMA